MVFQATAQSALFRMCSVESPGGDGHPGGPTICAYHVMVEEPTVHGLSGRVVGMCMAIRCRASPCARGRSPGYHRRPPPSPASTALTDFVPPGRGLPRGGYRRRLPLLRSLRAGWPLWELVSMCGEEMSQAWDLPCGRRAAVRLLVVDERGRPAACTPLRFGDETFGPDVEGPPIWPEWPEIHVFPTWPPAITRSM